MLHFTPHYQTSEVSCENLNFHNSEAALLMPKWIFYFSFSRKSFHSEGMYSWLYFFCHVILSLVPLCALAMAAALQLSASCFLSVPWRASGTVVKCCRSVTSCYKNTECQIVPQRKRSWSLVLQKS